jgi:hypothetical protein
MVVTVPPNPQFVAVPLPQADLGRNGEVSLPKDTDSVTAALLFSKLKI